MLMFASGFETGNLSEWSYVVGYEGAPVVEVQEPVEDTTYTEENEVRR